MNGFNWFTKGCWIYLRVIVKNTLVFQFTISYTLQLWVGWLISVCCFYVLFNIDVFPIRVFTLFSGSMFARFSVYIYIYNLEYWPLSCFVRFSFKNIVCRQFEHCWLDSQAIGSIISCLVLLILCVLKSKKLVMLEIFMIGSNWMY